MHLNTLRPALSPPRSSPSVPLRMVAVSEGFRHCWFSFRKLSPYLKPVSDFSFNEEKPDFLSCMTLPLLPLTSSLIFPLVPQLQNLPFCFMNINIQPLVLTLTISLCLGYLSNTQECGAAFTSIFIVFDASPYQNICFLRAEICCPSSLLWNLWLSACGLLQHKRLSHIHWMRTCCCEFDDVRLCRNQKQLLV